MEKVVTFGDLHGKDSWKKINPDEYDKIVFLADYVDDFLPTTNEQIYSNLMDIIEFKKKNMDKVILLIGNHDLPYLYLNDPAVPQCTGYRPDMAYNLHFLFNENKELFQAAYQIGNHLFTHAGVSEAWYNKHKDVIKEFWERLSHKDDQTGVTMADVLNGLMETHHRNILFEVGEARGGSRGSCGGIFWACYNETKRGVLNGYNHVVGHTNRPDLERIDFTPSTSITYCDILNSIPDKFLTIEI